MGAKSTHTSGACSAFNAFDSQVALAGSDSRTQRASDRPRSGRFERLLLCKKLSGTRYARELTRGHAQGDGFSATACVRPAECRQRFAASAAGLLAGGFFQ